MNLDAIADKAVPSNWLDPLLTRSLRDIPGRWDCNDIERLLNAIRPQVRAALAQVRDEALEEAAKEADKWATLEQRNHGNGGPSAAIRAMKEVNK